MPSNHHFPHWVRIPPLQPHMHSPSLLNTCNDLWLFPYFQFMSLPPDPRPGVLLCHQCLAHSRCSIRMWWGAHVRGWCISALGLDSSGYFHICPSQQTGSPSVTYYSRLRTADFLSTPAPTTGAVTRHTTVKAKWLLEFTPLIQKPSKTLTHWNQPKGPGSLLQTKHMLYQNIGITIMTIHLKRQLAHLKITTHSDTYMPPLNAIKLLNAWHLNTSPACYGFILSASRWTWHFHTHCPFNSWVLQRSDCSLHSVDEDDEVQWRKGCHKYSVGTEAQVLWLWIHHFPTLGQRPLQDSSSSPPLSKRWASVMPNLLFSTVSSWEYRKRCQVIKAIEAEILAKPYKETSLGRAVSSYPPIPSHTHSNHIFIPPSTKTVCQGLQ